MRFKLYEVEIERNDGRDKGHVVALSEQHAAEIIIDHKIVLDKEVVSFTLERVDHNLPSDRSVGLDDLLQSAPAGFASFCMQTGWVALAPASRKLRFFQIEEGQREKTYLIAPDANIAFAIYVSDQPLEKGEQRFLRIRDGLSDLPADRVGNIHSLLEIGPIGVVRFEEDYGWMVS